MPDFSSSEISILYPERFKLSKVSKAFFYPHPKSSKAATDISPLIPDAQSK